MFNFLKKKDKKKKEVSNIFKWQKKMMKKHGYYVHGVLLDDNNKSYMNYHTHGLKITFDLPELQIVFPVTTKLAKSIFGAVIYEIGNGGEIPLSELGPSDPFLLNLIDGDRILIKFNWTKDTPEHNSDDNVLRIILSDPNLRFKGDHECDPLHSGQEDFEITKED